MASQRQRQETVESINVAKHWLWLEKVAGNFEGKICGHFGNQKRIVYWANKGAENGRYTSTTRKSA